MAHYQKIKKEVANCVNKMGETTIKPEFAKCLFSAYVNEHNIEMICLMNGHHWLFICVQYDRQLFTFIGEHKKAPRSS